MTSSRERILSSLQDLKSDIARDYFVRRVGVFGSVARNEQTDRSDIDLLVEFSRPVGLVTFIRLERFLSDRLGSPVDLVTPDTLKAVIRQDILDEVIYV